MILEAKKLKQREIGKLLGIDQAEVSKLMNGQFTCSPRAARLDS
jgi:predicted XRE-type DNA-binding protein